MRKPIPVEENSLHIDRRALKRLRVSEVLEGLSLRMVAAPATPVVQKQKTGNEKNKSSDRE